MYDVMGSTPFLEVPTELGPSVRSYSRRPAKEVEPDLEMTGDGLGRESSQLLVDRVTRPFVHTNKELMTSMLKKIETTEANGGPKEDEGGSVTQGFELCNGNLAKHSRQEEIKVLMSLFMPGQ